VVGSCCWTTCSTSPPEASQLRSFAASQLRSFAASQLRSYAASQLRSFAASSFAASQLAASQLRSFAASSFAGMVAMQDDARCGVVVIRRLVGGAHLTKGVGSRWRPLGCGVHITNLALFWTF
jgi:hypothetical protein